MKMRDYIVTNKKGLTFIIAITLVMIAIVLIVPAMRTISTERRISDSLARSTNAFYAAESAANLGLRDLGRNTCDEEWNSTGWDRSDPNRYTLGAVTHVRLYATNTDTCMIALREPLTTTPIIEATGYSGDKQRSVMIGYNEQSTVPGNNFDKAIKTKGTIDIRGNAYVDENREEYANFNFEDVFGGRTMEEVKNDAYTQLLVEGDTEIPNNYEPVQRPAEDYTDSNQNGRYDPGLEDFVDEANWLGVYNGVYDYDSDVTWLDLSNGTPDDPSDDGTAMITRTDWNGEGILVVQGNLRITGGVFDGVIYVLGTLSMSTGNPEIRGTIFVDGNSTDVTTIGGTATINYDPTEIGDGIGRRFSRQPLSWREYFP